MTTKLNKYLLVKEYQPNFKSILQKLHEDRVLLLKVLQFVTFFHGVEEIYNQWAFTKCSNIQNKVKDEDLPTIDNLIAKFFDKSRIMIAVEAKTLAASRANNGCRNGDRPRTSYIFYKREGYKEDNW